CRRTAGVRGPVPTATARGGQPIVCHGGCQLKWRRDPGGRGAGYRQRRRLVLCCFAAASAAGARARRCNLPIRAQPTHRALSLTVRGHGPDHLCLFAEVARCGHREELAVESRVEIRRLTPIGPTGLNPVVRADRHADLLDVIAIEIPEPELITAVGVPGPPLEDRLDALTRVVLDVAAQRSVRLLCGGLGRRSS